MVRRWHRAAGSVAPGIGFYWNSGDRQSIGAWAEHGRAEDKMCSRSPRFLKRIRPVNFVSRFGPENCVPLPKDTTMPRPRLKKLAHQKVTGLAPLPPAFEEWERALIEPVLARLFDAPKAPTAESKEVRDGEDAR
jgi:hypothetical protein